MIEINAQRAVELLREVVAEKGADHVIPSGAGCLYYLRGGDPIRGGAVPSCIVGHALAKLGVDLADAVGGRNSTPIFHDVLLGTLREKAGVHLSPEAVQVWYIAQKRQDERETWGVALEHAEHTAASFAETTD